MLIQKDMKFFFCLIIFLQFYFVNSQPSIHYNEESGFCGDYLSTGDVCDDCLLQNKTRLKENSNKNETGNPLLTFLNKTLHEHMSFAVNHRMLNWSYSNETSFTSLMYLTAYQQIGSENIYRPIKSCCGVRLEAKACDLVIFGKNAYISVRLTAFRSIAYKLIGESRASRISELSRDGNFNKLLNVQHALQFTKAGGVDRLKYTCLFTMKKEHVISNYTALNHGISVALNREVYVMPRYKYIDNYLFSNSSSKHVECTTKYITDTFAYNLMFNNSDETTLTCLSLFFTYQESTNDMDVYCMPHKSNNYNKKDVESSNNSSFLLTVGLSVSIVLIISICIAGILVQVKKKTMKGIDIIPEGLKTVCENIEKSSEQSDYWDCSEANEEDVSTLDICESQIIHQVQKIGAACGSSTLTNETLKLQSDCESLRSQSEETEELDKVEDIESVKIKTKLEEADKTSQSENIFMNSLNKSKNGVVIVSCYTLNRNNQQQSFANNSFDEDDLKKEDLSDKEDMPDDGLGHISMYMNRKNFM